MTETPQRDNLTNYLTLSRSDLDSFACIVQRGQKTTILLRRALTPLENYEQVVLSQSQHALRT